MGFECADNINTHKWAELADLKHHQRLARKLAFSSTRAFHYSSASEEVR